MPSSRSPIRKRCRPLPIVSAPRSSGPRLQDWTLVLGPKFSKKDRAALPLPRPSSLQQVDYARNFIFRRNFPSHKIFQRSAELGVFGLTADTLAQIFGVRQHQRLRGQRHSLLEKLEHGHPGLRVDCQSLVAPRYEKFSTFLRLELCVHRLQALGLNKGLDHRDALPQKLVIATDRLANFHGQLLNVPVDFPFFQQLALPVASGKRKLPGIKLQDAPRLRLMEVLLHGGPQLAGWRPPQIGQAIRTAFSLSPEHSTLHQLPL